MKKLLTSDDIIRYFKWSKLTKPLVALGLNILGFRKINRLYSPSADLENLPFTDDMLMRYNITYDVNENELNCIPKEGPFMLVSNHPFGGIEGIILYNAIARVRPDFKIMANFVLGFIPNLKDVFFSVNPFENNKELAGSNGGIRASLNQLKEGHGLGVFPAGEVARYHGHSYPEDIAWSPSIAKLVQKTNVPVIPVYFDGNNSHKFYFLTRIHPILGTFRLVKELLNKRNKKLIMKIGKPILQSEVTQYETPEALAAYLKNRSYALQANISQETKKFRSRVSDPIDPPFRPSDLARELRAIRKKSLLFTTADFECYLADYDKIPHVMHEMGRRREEAFRAVGEGTGKSIDTDNYDTYYKHLILWDTKEQTIAGGYRIGIGDEIYKNFGARGFYVDSLFNIDPKFEPYLKETIELGRSFVSVDYQKDILPLLLLLKGLMETIMRYPTMNYFIGPVSISSWFPKFYQSLMVYYVTTKHTNEEMSKLFHPKTPFVPNFNKCDIEVLLEKNMETVDKFDRYLMKLSNGDYRMPTLFKKYLKINSKFLCFNVDPDFNDTLDGLLLLKFTDYPKEELDMMLKDIPEEKRPAYYKRFGKELS
ncbi:MAG: lysophospholipid acyltransferase family protein [Bacteroidales bacterium]|nr:lysophospholipid acyltransferase family protein [Bacteroidales bacterium]